MTDRFNVHTNPHDIVQVRTYTGDTQRVTYCMLERLENKEIIDGEVPDGMPEYNRPLGSVCHSNWRGGCPEENTSPEYYGRTYVERAYDRLSSIKEVFNR